MGFFDHKSYKFSGGVGRILRDGYAQPQFWLWYMWGFNHFSRPHCIAILIAGPIRIMDLPTLGEK